jgi:hypothetical protein
MNEARHKFLPAPKDRSPERSGFVFPGPQDRLTINGMTGSGKTTFAFWLFGECADFDKKPWIVVDYKQADPIINGALAEGIFDELKLSEKIPRDAGVFVIRPRAQEGATPVVQFLWKVYEAGRVGLFLDEATMIPELRGEGNSGGPFQSLLSQGRSKNIPVWTLAQRPAHVNKMVYSESDFYCAFKLGMTADLDKIRKEGIPEWSEGYERVWGDKVRLKPFTSRWYDRKRERSFILNPAPAPNVILNILANRVDAMQDKRTL